VQILKYFKNWLLVVIGLSLISSAYAQDDKKNKLVEFKGFFQWEVWCIDINQSGNIECNLNHVLRYKDHPDFRAMIFRFFSDGDQITRMTIDHEWQSSFSRGFIQIDDFDQVGLSHCEKVCELHEQQLTQIVDQMSSGDKAMIRFHDYLVQEFEENIPLSGFVQGMQSLVEMQNRY